MAVLDFRSSMGFLRGLAEEGLGEAREFRWEMLFLVELTRTTRGLLPIVNSVWESVVAETRGFL